MDAPATAAGAAATVSTVPSNDSPTVRQQPQPAPQSQQTSSQPLQQTQQPQSSTTGQPLVVSTSSASGNMPLVSSGNTVVLSSPSQIAGLMAQSAGVAQNSIRLQQQPQQHLIMAPMNMNMNNALMYGNYLTSPHPVMAQGNQFIISNVNQLPNQSIFLNPPHSTNITTITGRRSGISTGQNIQPRPQSQILPAQIYRPNLTQQIIAQSSGVSTTPTNIQPRPQQSFLQGSPILRAANIPQQLFAQQSFPAVFSQNQIGWPNSVFTFRNPNDPIQILPQQTQLQIPFMHNNVQVPAASAPVVSVTPAATAAVPTAAPTTTTATPTRMKPIAVRPASGPPATTSSSMGTQTTLRTTTTVADVTKNNITRTKVVSGPGRPASVTSSPVKLANGPVTQVRDADVSTARSSPATTSSHPPVNKTDVSSATSATPNASDQKGEIKVPKASPVTGKNSSSSVNHNGNKDAAGDRVLAVRRPGDKRDNVVGNENVPIPAAATASKKSESPRLRNGIKSQNEVKKIAEPEKVAPEILIHVIEEYVIEESSKPFPVNGSTDPPHAENGVSRPDGAANLTDSPEELIITTPRLSDTGECQKCQSTGPKTRLKLKNGMRVCQACFSKRPASKLDLMNTVTSSPSEYDFRDNDNHQVAKGASSVVPEAEAVADGRKRPRLSKKSSLTADAPVSCSCNHVSHRPLKTFL
jgi:hypothetical protein